MVGAPSPTAPPALVPPTGAGTGLQVGPRPGCELPVLEVRPALVAGGPTGAAGPPQLADASLLFVPVGSPTSSGSPGPGAGADRPVLPGPGADWLREMTGLDVVEVCRLAQWRAAAGTTLPLHGAPAATRVRLVLLGTGSGSLRDLRRAGAALARAARGSERTTTTAASGLEGAALRSFAEGLLLGAWSPPRAVSREVSPQWEVPPVQEGPDAAPAVVALLGASPAASGALAAAAIAVRATWRVRDLAATPSSTKTPAWVASQARALAAAARPGSGSLRVTVLDEVELAQRRAGGLLAVGAASQHPPCLVRVDWTPDGSSDAAPRRVVLVGKGITFDTGGLALKPRESMVAMKTDMAGAAVVLATVVAAAEAGLPRPVTALLPLAENSLGAASYRPGDVVRILDGTTVEVDNPDAEGRLVLADALALADAELDPALLVDVATLTGAATQGLGRQHAALFTEDDELAALLSAAGEAAGERVWRMPLVEEYRASLESDVADLRHVPSSPSPGAGAVTAALFLREFAGRRRWAHLDIAGVGRSERESHEVPKGATGWGARLLLRLLEDLP